MTLQMAAVGHSLFLSRLSTPPLPHTHCHSLTRMLTHIHKHSRRGDCSYYLMQRVPGPWTSRWSRLSQ